MSDGLCCGCVLFPLYPPLWPGTLYVDVSECEEEEEEVDDKGVEEEREALAVRKEEAIVNETQAKTEDTGSGKRQRASSNV